MEVSEVSTVYGALLMFSVRQASIEYILKNICIFLVLFSLIEAPATVYIGSFD